MCFLCLHTFSRSDILKRHFQKCSIHRGNPTGASHVSRPEAHVKKNAQAQKAQGMPNGDIVNTMPEDGMLHPFGMVLAQDGCGIVPSVTDGSQPCGGDVNPMDRLNMHPSHPGWYAHTYWNRQTSSVQPWLGSGGFRWCRCSQLRLIVYHVLTCWYDRSLDYGLLSSGDALGTAHSLVVLQVLVLVQLLGLGKSLRARHNTMNNRSKQSLIGRSNLCTEQTRRWQILCYRGKAAGDIASFKVLIAPVLICC